MVRSRLFGLFILALCIVACVCAHAVGSREDATEAVKKTKKITVNVLDKVKKELSDAVELQKDIDTQRNNAEAAAAEAAAAEAIVAKSYKEVEAIAQKVKNASAKVFELHPNAFAAAKSIVDEMNALLTNARELYNNVKDLIVSEDSSTNFTKIKEDADSKKAQADALDDKIKTAKSSFDSVRAKKYQMVKLVSDARLAKYHIDVIVSLSEIDTLLESAESDIQLIEKKRDEIKVTEQEMKELFNNSPTNLIYYFSSLHSTVEGHLRDTLHNVDEAKEAKGRMLKQKESANSSLVKVQVETNYLNAYQEVRNSQLSVKNAKNILKDTKRALLSANISAINARYRKNAAENKLNERAKKTGVTQYNKETNHQDSSNTHQPVQDTKESPAGSETTQYTIPIPVKTVSVKPKEDAKDNDADIEEKKPIITTQDQQIIEQPVDKTTESPEGNETEKPTITNAEKPVSGGPEPRRHSLSDSAMNLSAPLLLAMVAYAALH